MSLVSKICDKCGTDKYLGWCKPCQINNFKKFNCTSGNKEIDSLIKKMHLKINSFNDIVFEWIPYNQLENIKEISKGDFATIYSAIWKGGPLYYNKKEYTRKSDKKVALRCI